MRLINAEALIPMMKYATTDNEIGVFPIRIGFDAIKKVIDDAPTIDAVEVVRCKDCKYWVELFKGCKRNPCVEAWHRHDFCSYGERRELDDENTAEDKAL